MMNTKETIFLFRDGQDDYTIWIVDFPEKQVNMILHGNGMVRGSLENLLSQLPLMTEKTANRLQMLTHNGKEYVLHSKDAPFAMIEEYHAEGCSIRGDKESIIRELKGCFPLMDAPGHFQTLS